MTASIERELGEMRSDIQNLTRSVDRLIGSMDRHAADDTERFQELYSWRDRLAGQLAAGKTVATAGTGILGLLSGGVGAWVMTLVRGH